MEKVLKKYQIIKETEKAVCLKAEVCSVYGGRFVSWDIWVPKSALVITENEELGYEAWFYRNFKNEKNMSIERFLKIGEVAFDEQSA